MNSDIKKIIDNIIKETPDWSYYESHQFENSLVDEGEYVKSKDVVLALNKLAEQLIKKNTKWKKI